MKKGTLIILGAILFAFIFLVVVRHEKNKEQKKSQIDDARPMIVKMSFLKELGDVNTIFDFASDKGFFEKNNLEVQVVDAQKDITSLLSTGAADVVLGNATGPLAAYLGNGQIRLLANIAEPFSYFGLSRFSSDNFSSIKRVAVNTLAGDPPITMKNALRNMGVDPSNVEMVAVPTQEARQIMLANGDIDFTIVASEKFVADNSLDKKYTIVMPEVINKSLFLPRQINTSEQALKKNQQGVKAFVVSIYQALKYMKNNPEEIKQYFTDKYGFDKDRSTFYYQRFLTGMEAVSFVPDVGASGNLADFLKQETGIKSERDVSGYVFDDYAKQAVGK